MSAEGGAPVSIAEAGAHASRVAHHFQDFEQQRHAARFGMWLFLGTEVLLFGGLFVAYAIYRVAYGDAFHEASCLLDLKLGTTNTVVLITSSFAVAAAVHYAHLDQKWPTVISLLLTIGMGLAFLGIKSVEYAHKFQEGALPGKYYHFEKVQEPGASMFFTVYFFLTGLHGIHVLIGLSVLSWLTWRAIRGDFKGGYDLPVELGGLYWHLVDIVWIFLFPLLYLA